MVVFIIILSVDVIIISSNKGRGWEGCCAAYDPAISPSSHSAFLYMA